MVYIKKRFVFVLLFIFLLHSSSFAFEGIDVSEFIDEVKTYNNDIFPEFANENWLNNILNGNLEMSGQTIIKKVLNLILKEFKENTSLLFKIIGITFICAILKNLQSAYDSNVSEIAFYVCYMLIIVLIVSAFSNISNVCISSIKKLKDFMELIIPLLIALLVGMGNISTATILQPVLLGMISVISILVSNLVIPIVMTSTVLNLVSNISTQINVDKIGTFLKKTVMYILEFVMIIFIGLLSIEGSLASGVDGVTSKITKTVVSNAVPVVGKLISDTADSVLGGISITKNAVGIIGILVILIIAITPLVKSFILMTLFNLTSAICDSIADARISKCMSVTADSMKLMFGIMVMISFLFVIAITLMIKMTNFSLIYR